MIKPVANKRRKEKLTNLSKENAYMLNSTNDIVTHKSQCYHHTV